MLAQSVDRAADATEVTISLMSVISELIDWFDSNRDMGDVERSSCFGYCAYCAHCAYCA